MKTQNEAEALRQYLAQVVIYRDQLDRQKFMAMANGPSVRAFDTQGRELQFNRVRESNISDTEARLSLMFYRHGGGGGDEVGTEVGEPVKLVWELVTRSKDIDVPFEFKDLPMP